MMHVGNGARPSRTEAKYLSPPRRLYTTEETSQPVSLDTSGNPVGFIDFTTDFKNLYLIVHHSLNSDAVVDKRKFGIERLWGT
jgi:hypothetical protein